MSKNLDHLTTEQKIRHYRGLATLSNGEFREDLYLKILKRMMMEQIMGMMHLYMTL